MRTLTEGRRGCGRRKGGGAYLVAGAPSAGCGKLPAALELCPVCGEGIQFSMNPKWIDPHKLFGNLICQAMVSACHTCPLGAAVHVDKLQDGLICQRDGAKTLLLWVGKTHYKTPDDFLEEASRMGVSRRVKGLPRGFVVGRDWVFFAHMEAIRRACPSCQGVGVVKDDDGMNPAQCDGCDGQGFNPVAGAFSMFRPQAVEYVLSDGEEAVLAEANSADYPELWVLAGLDADGLAAQDDEGRTGHARLQTVIDDVAARDYVSPQAARVSVCQGGWARVNLEERRTRDLARGIHWVRVEAGPDDHVSAIRATPEGYTPEFYRDAEPAQGVTVEDGHLGA